MDNPQEPPTVLSLCSGYGGLEIGIERAIGTINVVAHVEIETYAAANLVAKIEEGKMAPSLIYTDLKTLNYEIFRGKIDIITGGYPCQPFTQAGKRLGKEDPRHLWPHIRDAIDIVRPRYCFFENVEGHITEGLYDVLDDLGGLGYRTTWEMFSAVECGFIHERKRIFILAHANGITARRWLSKVRTGEREARFLQKEYGQLLPSEIKGRFRNEPPKGFNSKPLLRRGNDGLRNWTDRLRLVGNGVVPQTAELAFRTLMRELMQ